MIALHGGHVISQPHAEPAPATVLIEGGKIAAVAAALEIPAQARTIDCAGCTIVAGFWNSHVHFFERKWACAPEIPAEELSAQLRDFERFGFTTVFDLSSAYDNTSVIRGRIDSGEVQGPHMFTTGPGIVPPGFDLPDTVFALLGQMKVPLPYASDAAEARRVARSLLDGGADAIKLFASIPSGATLSVATMRAAVDEAHGAGVRVFVHPNTADDIERALDAGVDVIAHTTPRSGPWSEELLDNMGSHNVALIPTLSLWDHLARHDRHSVQQRQIQTAVQQLASWRKRGGTILFGMDVGMVGCDPEREYALMCEAGMSADEVVAALTTAPAALLGDARRNGKIAPGFDADIAIVAGDPLRNVHALRDVTSVLHANGVLQVSQ